ncbi:MAG: hypothetical protein V9E83_08150 [Baekduia sp.]
MPATARSRYELIVTNRSIEIVDHTSAEAVLFWDCTRTQLRRMREAIIADLDRLSPDDFLHEWASIEPTDFA